MSKTKKRRKKNEIRKRINKLKKEADKLCGGKMVSWESDTEKLPPEIRESFWERVVNFEKASYTTTFAKLTESGFELLPPESMDSQQLADKLSKLILSLAQMNCFLLHTDHLSDRDLYSTLYNDVLRQEIADLEYDENEFQFLDITGSGSEEDHYINLKYYSDEKERSFWTQEFPEDTIPAQEDTPYDRDSHLPKPEFFHSPN